MAGQLKLMFVLQAVDKATEKVQGVQQRIDAVTAPLRRASEAFNIVREKVSKLAETAGVSRIKAAWNDLHERIAKLPMVAAISMAGVVAALTHTEQKLNSLVLTAKNLGMAAGEFQKLSYAAQQAAGLGPEELAGALEHLTRSLNEARMGSKEAQQMFALNGIKPGELQKITAMEAVFRIADKFHTVADTAHNTEVKMQSLFALLGRSGAPLRNFFDQGRGGIRGWMEEYVKFGGVLTEADAKGVRSFSQAMVRLGSIFDGMMIRITTALNPALEKLLATITGKNQKQADMIVKVVSDALVSLVDNLPQVLKGFSVLTKGVVMLFSALAAVSEALGGWEPIFTAIAAVVGVKATLGVIALAKAVGLLGKAIFTTPIGWLAVAITGLVIAVWKNWDDIRGGWNMLWENMADKVRSFATWFGDIMKPVFGWIDKYLGGNSVIGRLLTGSLFQAGGPAPTIAGGGQGGPGIVSGAREATGRVQIEIKSPFATRVTDLSKGGDGWLDLDVYSGQTMAMP